MAHQYFQAPRPPENARQKEDGFGSPGKGGAFPAQDFKSWEGHSALSPFRVQRRRRFRFRPGMSDLPEKAEPFRTAGGRAAENLPSPAGGVPLVMSHAMIITVTSNTMDKTLDELKDLEELEQALQESAHHPVLLFKHSLTCPISSRAFQEFQTYLEAPDSRVAYKLITVQTARQVSGGAAERLGVTHQSPQAILVKNGVSVWDASHYNITSESLSQAIREFAV